MGTTDDPDIDDRGIDDRDIAAFASRLEAHAERLDDRERRLLDQLLIRAMTPLQRRALEPTPERFSADERALVERLAEDD